MRGIFFICVIFCGIVFAGCGSSKRTVVNNGGTPNNAPTNPDGSVNTTNATGTHFSMVESPSGQFTRLVQNGHSNGAGLAYWHDPVGVVGNNITVRVTFYFGPFGADDNSLQSGQQPYLWPNYADGAEAGRGAADYVPIALSEVPGSNGRLWETTLTKFPASGRFLYTLTRNGGNQADVAANAFATGLQNDSSYDASRQALQARYDGNIVLPLPPL